MEFSKIEKSLVVQEEKKYRFLLDFDFNPIFSILKAPSIFSSKVSDMTIFRVLRAREYGI